jgi:MFS family permease
MAANALILATQTSVAHASRPDNRDYNFGYFAFWISVGQLLGPVLGGGLAEASSIRTALYACAGVSLVPGVAALWLPRAAAGGASADDLPRGLRAREVYGAAWRLAKRRDLQFVMLVAFVIIFSWSIKSSFYPLYLKMVGLPTSLIGTIFSILGAGSMLVRPLVGTVATRYGVQRVLMGAVAVATVAIGVTPLLHQFWPLALAALSTGMAWGFTQPLTMSLIAGSVAPAERGLALSLRMTSNRLAEVVSPIVFGGMIALAGLGSAFFLSAGVLAAGLVIIARFAGAMPSTAAQGLRTDTMAPAHRASATGSPRERPAPASPDRG